MTREEAHQVLDRVKNGIWQPSPRIKEALFVTGDLRQDRIELRETSHESCYVRSRQIYGASAYEREFGPFQQLGQRCESED